MQILSMDYMSLPAAAGYKLVLVIIDYFTQYIWAYKFKTAGTGKTTIKSLTDLFRIFGQPEVLLSDNGSHFANREVEAFCADRAIVLARTPPYLPHTNRAVKGANRLLINVLKKELAAAGLDKNSRNNQWPTALDPLVSQLNSRVVGTTGHCPADLLFAYVRRNKDPRQKPLGSNELAAGLGKALTAVLDWRLEAAAHVAFSQARHELAFETMFKRQAKRKAARNALQARVLQRQPNSGQPIRQRIHAHRLNPYHGKRPRSMTHELLTLNKFFRHLRNAPELDATPVAGAVVTPGAASTDSDNGQANVDNKENPNNNNNEDDPLMMLHKLFKLPPVIPNPEPGAAGTLAVPHAIASAHKATPEGRFVKNLTTKLPPPGKPSGWALAIGQVFATLESLPVHFLTEKVSAWSTCTKPPVDERPAVDAEDCIRTDLAKLCKDAGSMFSDNAADEV
ncbi:hypothetical protein ACM66B_004325 [Microbotryomycetes sp. NB124-2]